MMRKKPVKTKRRVERTSEMRGKRKRKRRVDRVRRKEARETPKKRKKRKTQKKMRSRRRTTRMMYQNTTKSSTAHQSITCNPYSGAVCISPAASRRSMSGSGQCRRRERCQ
jgi:hypothetical protein